MNINMIRVALRNVFRQYQRTLLLGSAIAFGLMVVILINSLTAGLARSLTLNIADIAGGHIFITGTELSELGNDISIISDTDKLEQALTSIQSDVASYNIRSERFASFIFGSKEQSAALTGVDFENDNEAIFLQSLDLLEGNLEDILAHEDSLILPQKFVDKLGITLGESVIIKSGTITGQENIINLTLRGIISPVNEMLSQFFSQGYAPLQTVNDLSGIAAGQYANYQIRVHDMDDAPKVAETLRAALSEIALVEESEDFIQMEGAGADEDMSEEEKARAELASEYSIDLEDADAEEEVWQGTKFGITTIQEQLSFIKTVNSVLQNIALGIFIVLLVIIMVGIVNSYRMVMLERTPEIGTMRAMGVQRGGIRSIFIWEAIFVGLVGVVLGLLLAFLLMFGLSFLSFPTDNPFSLFLNEGHLRFIPTILPILGNALLICVMSMIAVLIPAFAAARLNPAEALRS